MPWWLIYGTLQYIGDDGTERNQKGFADYFRAKVELKVKFNPETMENNVTNDFDQISTIAIPPFGILSYQDFPSGYLLFG
jgi:hypothetical protein